MCSQKVEQELLSNQMWPFLVSAGTALHGRLFSADYSCGGHPWVMVALPACPCLQLPGGFNTRILPSGR